MELQRAKDSTIGKLERAQRRGSAIKEMVEFQTHYYLTLAEMLYEHITSGDYKREMQVDNATIYDYFNQELKMSPDHGFTLLRIHDALIRTLKLTKEELEGMSHKKLYAVTRFAESKLDARTPPGKRWKPMENRENVIVAKEIKHLLNFKNDMDREGFSAMVNAAARGEAYEEVHDCEHPKKHVKCVTCRQSWYE